MIKTRFISILALLITAVTGAWAQTEELLTTITLGGEPWLSLQPVYTESGRATLETSGNVEEGWVCPEINGWSNSSPLAIGSVTINPAEGYTITKVVFWDYEDGYYNALTDNASPFTCYLKGSMRSLNEDMSSPNGYAIAKIEVYGYASTVAVTGVTLAPTSATLTLGETETVTLIPTVLPGDATDKSVTWSSSNEAVATVADGVVTAVAAGEATITVTTTDGAKTATCAVTVAAPAASTYTVTLKEGTDDADNWTITPAEATTTGVAAGTEVKATYGGTKKVKSVKAVKKAPATVPVTAITLNKTATTIQAGQTETLSVSSVTPDDATDQTVTWSSDNEAVATVDADGKVTAVAFGTANITATANDGSGVTATCAVTVSKVVTINQSDWGMNYSFTKDGVTVSADYIDSEDGNIMGPGTFSTTLGNFTKIVVTSSYCDAYGTGWSSSWLSSTWAGTPASTVSFSGNFQGMGEALTTIVCTIVPKN